MPNYINLIQSVKNRIDQLFLTPINYWQRRAEKLGVRSVININNKNFEEITEYQKQLLFPLLKQRLRGDEKVLLDFGCGPGRFTIDLANITGCKTFGIDPISELIDIAPKNHNNVEYIVMKEGELSLPDNSIDILWICLVLGGIISNRTLRKTINELERVLKKDGLVFIVENTSDKKSKGLWKFRSVDEYISLFPFTKIKHLSDYFDCGERISIFSNR